MKKRNTTAEIITKTMIKQTIIPIFEDIKDLIKSTAKGTETVLRKEISKVSDELKLTQSALKATKEDLEGKMVSMDKGLRGEIDNMGKDLRGKIDSMGKDLRGEIKDSEGRITEKLQGNIKDTEIRLTEKIDSIHIRVDNHETRIAALESPGH